MIRRFLFWNYAPNVSDRNGLMTTLRLHLESLKNTCPGLLNVEVGATQPGSTHDLALCCTFSDRNALDAYQFNPEQLSLWAEVDYQLRDRVCTDLEI